MTKRAVGVWTISIKDLITMLRESDEIVPDWMEEPNLEYRVRYDGKRISFMGVVTEYETKILPLFPNLIHQEGETNP